MEVQQAEQAVYDHDSCTTAVNPVDGLAALAWQRRRSAVDKVPLTYVFEEMNRFSRRRSLSPVVRSPTGASAVHPPSPKPTPFAFRHQFARCKRQAVWT